MINKEINNDKVILIGSNYSGKTELGVEMAYSSLKLGNKVNYITTEDNIESIKSKFFAKDFINGLSIVNKDSLNVMDNDTLCKSNTEDRYDIYVFDGISTKDFEKVIKRIGNFEDFGKVGILFITNKGNDFNESSNILDEEIQYLFKKCYSIVSSTVIDKKELLGKEIDTYIMRLNILDMSRLLAVDEEIFIDILSK